MVTTITETPIKMAENPQAHSEYSSHFDKVKPSPAIACQEADEVDVKRLAREIGDYSVHPDIKYPELKEFDHHDPGHRADPAKKSLFINAEKVIELTPQIGTEIHGLQLSQLTDQQKDDLALLVAERGVVFFRNQDLTPRKAVDLIKHFGPAYIHPTVGHPPGLPEVSVLYFSADQRIEFYEGTVASDHWHSDVTFEKQPPGLIILKNDMPPPSGGDTCWSSSYVAYDRLSAPMKKFLEGLEAVHTGAMVLEDAKKTGCPIRRDGSVDAVHPVVRTHPVTKRKAIFVNPYFTRHIVGMARRESEAILQFLYRHMESIDFQVRLKWEEDTVAVWDNRVTNHNVAFDYFYAGGKRHAFRVAAQAEKPYLDPSV
ncbi:hypothetical protein BJV82DRAFT_605617 [Fennellomyces sp. T-0311]|nr:hypothetical protein BJV82DRAFT_605617 [Fennellomyces sp. T-0311]